MRLALWFLCATFLWAEALESTARYKVGYGFFTLGEATAVLKIDGEGRYETRVSAKATGLAATLSGNQREFYVSKGRVIDGRLQPDFYEKRMERSNRVRTKRYRFNHDAQTVLETKISCKKDKCSQSEKKLTGEKYAPDDILTLYHNVTHHFIQSGESARAASAIGSSKAVEVLLPTGDRLKTAQKTFKEQPGTYLVVILNQEIFTSDQGELYMNVGADRVTSKAVLKKTLLFGDVWGELIEKKTKGSFHAANH